MRIASLAPSATTMLQELGVADQIVACTHVCPLPTPLKKRLAIGSFSVLNEDKLATSQPDLVITATLVQATGQARLKAAGYNVLHLDPHRLTDIAKNYAALGEAIGKRRTGTALKHSFLEQLSAYQLPVTDYKLQVYMEEWHAPPFISGNWVPDIVAVAGGRSVLISPGEPSREISFDELRAADPDTIIQHVCLAPGRDWTTHREQLRAQLLRRPGWEGLRAVERGNVWSLNDTPFNMPTRGVLEGIAMLRNVLQKAQAKAQQR